MSLERQDREPLDEAINKMAHARDAQEFQQGLRSVIHALPDFREIQENTGDYSDVFNAIESQLFNHSERAFFPFENEENFWLTTTILELTASYNSAQHNMRAIRDAVDDFDSDIGSADGEQPSAEFANKSWQPWIANVSRDIRKHIHANWDCKAALSMIEALQEFIEAETPTAHPFPCGYPIQGSFSAEDLEKLRNHKSYQGLMELIPSLTFLTALSDLERDNGGRIVLRYIKANFPKALPYIENLSQNGKIQWEELGRTLSNLRRQIYNHATEGKDPEIAQDLSKVWVLLKKIMVVYYSQKINEMTVSDTPGQDQAQYLLEQILVAMGIMLPVKDLNYDDLLQIEGQLNQRITSKVKILSDEKSLKDIKVITSIVKTSAESLALRTIRKAKPWFEKQSIDKTVEALNLSDLIKRIDAPIENPQSSATNWGGKGHSLMQANEHLKDWPEPENFSVSVPNGSILSTFTSAYLDRFPNQETALINQIREEIEALEAKTGKKLGDPKNPLILMARSGASKSLPGLLPTISHIGLNNEILESWSEDLSPIEKVYAYRSYLHFVIDYALFGVGAKQGEIRKALGGLVTEALRSTKLDKIQRNIEALKKLLKDSYQTRIPDDPWQQIITSQALIRAQFRSPEIQSAIPSKADLPLGSETACVIQECQPVRHPKDASGVILSRDLKGGRNLILEYATDFGTEVVDGTGKPKGADAFSQEFGSDFLKEVSDLVNFLEAKEKRALDIEFAIRHNETGKPTLHIVQMRPLIQTGLSAAEILFDLYDRGIIDLKSFKSRFDQEIRPIIMPLNRLNRVKSIDLPIIARGKVVGDNAVSGRIFWDLEAAQKCSDPVIYLSKENIPDQIYNNPTFVGSVTSEGGVTAHAALVALAHNKTALTSVPWQKDGDQIKWGNGTSDEININSGEWVTIDPRKGELIRGKASIRKVRIEALVIKNFRKRIEGVID